MAFSRSKQVAATHVDDDDVAQVDMENDEGEWLSAGDIKLGMVIDLPSRGGRAAVAACKIVEFNASKTGKHGGRKVTVVGVDVFNGKKREHMCMSGDKVFVPRCPRSDYVLLSATVPHGEDWGTCTVLGKAGSRSIPFYAEDQLGERVMQLSADQAAGTCDNDLLVTVLSCRGQEKVVQIKESKPK